MVKHYGSILEVQAQTNSTLFKKHVVVTGIIRRFIVHKSSRKNITIKSDLKDMRGRAQSVQMPLCFVSDS